MEIVKLEYGTENNVMDIRPKIDPIPNTNSQETIPSMVQPVWYTDAARK